MNLAVIKLGGRISLNPSGISTGTGEVISLIKIMKDYANVTAYTKILKKDLTPDFFHIKNIEDTYKEVKSNLYDALIVINGNVNFFGGAEDRSQILNYTIINNFDGPVFYFITDLSLILSQIWPSVSKKSWGVNYSEKDINIKRNDIIFISQAKDVEEIKSKILKNKINPKDVIYFPFSVYPMFMFKNEKLFNESPEYDLSYGGSFRGGRRKEDMIKFYFGLSPKIKVEMFGNISSDNFKDVSLSSPLFNKGVSQSEFIQKMYNSKSTIIISDDFYKKADCLTLRIYESIMAGTVTFIDSSYDIHRRLFSSKELLEYLYIKDRNDYIEKFNKLADINFRKHIVDEQKANAKITLEKYQEELFKCLQK